MEKTAKIYVAGHHGLVGSAIWNNLQQKGYTNLVGRSHKELDLLDGQAVKEFFDEEQPRYVILAAAHVGGIMANSLYRADFIYLNKLGWPIALQMGMETASFSLSAIMVGWIGTTALAAHQIMLAISQVCFMMYYGMGAAVAVRVSNFRGQNDRINVRRSAYAGFHIMLFIALIGALPIFLLRNELGGWFSDSPAVSVMVAQLIIPFIIYQFGDGLQINFANALRGIADVKPMMYIAFIAYFLISLPAGYFFGFIMDWGIIGIWMAFPFGLTTAGILYYLRFNRDTK